MFDEDEIWIIIHTSLSQNAPFFVGMAETFGRFPQLVKKWVL
jgi:hypothetical protein